MSQTLLLAPEPAPAIEWVQVLAFTVRGEPVAWQRAGNAVPDVNVMLGWARKVFDGQLKGKAIYAAMPKGGRYTPAETVRYERDVQIACQRAMQVHRVTTIPAGTPVRLEITLVHRRRKDDVRACRARHRLPKPTKPDADNEAKGIKDGLEKAGLYANDSQVTDLLVQKRWAAMDDDLHCEFPHAHVVVSIPQETP